MFIFVVLSSLGSFIWTASILLPSTVESRRFLFFFFYPFFKCSQWFLEACFQHKTILGEFWTVGANFVFISSHLETCFELHLQLILTFHVCFYFLCSKGNEAFVAENYQDAVEVRSMLGTILILSSSGRQYHPHFVVIYFQLSVQNVQCVLLSAQPHDPCTSERKNPSQKRRKFRTSKESVWFKCSGPKV